MLKASLAAFGITIGLILIPIVHFITGPISPAVGGFIGGSIIKATPGQGALIGGAMAFLMALVTLAVLSILHNFDIVVARNDNVLMTIAIGATIYTGILGALGAMIGGQMSRR